MFLIPSPIDFRPLAQFGSRNRKISRLQRGFRTLGDSVGASRNRDFYFRDPLERNRPFNERPFNFCIPCGKNRLEKSRIGFTKKAFYARTQTVPCFWGEAKGMGDERGLIESMYAMMVNEQSPSRLLRSFSWTFYPPPPLLSLSIRCVIDSRHKFREDRSTSAQLLRSAVGAVGVSKW